MAMKNYFLSVILLMSFLTFAQAQKGEEILFSVGDMDVSVSEFKYIYEKNNQESIQYDRNKVMEYLELYKNFKLKVHAATDERLDTIPTIREELENYKGLISKSYIIDKEVLEKMAYSTFERMQQDREFSHIFVAIDNPDTTTAFAKISKAQKDLAKRGASFEQIVELYSEDENTIERNGNIGFMSAPFSNGFYDFENAVYSLNLGEVSDIVRSKAGYHIVKLLSYRPARGTMQAAHIFVEKPRDNDQDKIAEAKKKIQEAYDALQSGYDFGSVVRTYSEDRSHIANDGYIGKVAVNTFSAEFEDAAFSLEEDGTYTGIVETPVGYHIIRRISAENPRNQNFAERKDELINIIRNTERFNTAMNRIITSVYKDGKINIHDKNLNEYIDQLDSTFITFSWKPHRNDKDLIVYKTTGVKYTGNDFGTFLASNSSERLRLRNLDNLEEDVKRLFDIFKRETAMKYEEAQLDSKYPEFRHLIREYREGILLFEITKDKVWDKAAQDTVGLQEFFNNNRENYKWDRRAVIQEYTFKGLDGHKLEDIVKYVGSHNAQETIANYGSDHVSYRSNTIEKGSSRDVFTWSKNEVYEINRDKNNGNVTLSKVEDILDPVLKTLNESRGYVISDYQQTLEESWLKELKEKYPYTLNESVLNRLIK